MKFLYQYRTSDNIQHEGVIFAASRDSAFAELRANGVRPARMTVAPGLLNFILGRGKRWIAICLLSLATLCFAFLWLRSSYPTLEPVFRHQIYGDPAIIDQMRRNNFKDVFESEGERYLANFAQPGTPLPEVDVGDKSLIGALTSAMTTKDSYREDDVREVRELRQIVAWMKSELRSYVAGGGTMESYIEQLKKRQLQEIRLFSMAEKDLEGVRDSAVWEQKNAALRRLGLRTVPVPDDVD